ncbi:hypothetical protein PYCCODRAFT_1453986 [Trametes coccinea BRFM310]|uniref:Protein OS-9 homolog n=1 Tax=Trametes coccinea (strain BRFM310) TaxID=1353009 RepID=A0A1Y2IEC2_TRAC3|nr:hypothetical protein PYCCODRAFT_1453986 [Trametes coccinea BRFM310]
MFPFALSIPLSLALLVSARVHHSRVPEDPYAFPKYSVSFLHGLPVLNETAERWLRDGLRGGELEFLDEPWQESQWHATQRKSIEAGDDSAPSDAASGQRPNYTLQHMKMGPKSSFVCLIPPPPQEPPAVEDTPTDVSTPVHSWSLLQPLSGKCLYHRQGWFTYSYCHNSHVRQFHELHHQHIPPTGEYKPEEDPEWEAYTLGRAPATLEAGAELTTAEAAAAANLELARGAGSRYLVQRWGDGTYCDKTGRKRDVEIQFHCSMTMTDTILFVKETQTCHYVVHIATPRLCGEPGFRSRVDSAEEHPIRCREVLDAEQYNSADRSLPEASHPFRFVRPQKKVIASPPPPPAADARGKDGATGKAATGPADPHGELLRRALQRLLARQNQGGGADTHVVVEQLPDGEGELLIEFVDIELPEGVDGDGEVYAEDYVDEEEGAGAEFEGRLHDILRAAGYDIKQPPKTNTRGRGAEDESDGRDAAERRERGGGTPPKKRRDEL